MGYTLPVFACASAIAALQSLKQNNVELSVAVDLIKPPQIVNIPIEQVAPLNSQSALAITRSDPGEHLDITRNTPIWALVLLQQRLKNEPQIETKGGAGIGIQTHNNNQAAIYSYATELIIHNLQPLLTETEKISITIILPEGQKLALKTSNSAFGVVEGLSLLGTTGIVQPLTAPNQLAIFQTELIAKAKENKSLVFCIGENGLDLAKKWGIKSNRLVKTANWIGSMLVLAAQHQVQSITLIGYHGKLIKLAGGIWHTHHHLADGRLEIFISFCARYGLETNKIKQVADCTTTELALQLLRQWDSENNSNWVETIYNAIAESIVTRSQDYIYKHTDKKVSVNAILFDRQREIIYQNKSASSKLQES